MLLLGFSDATDEHERLQSSVATFYEALVAGDVDLIRNGIFIKDDPEKETAAAQARRMLANLRLVATLSANLEIPHGEHPLGHLHLFTGDDVAFAMGAGVWEITGNVATVPARERMGGADQPPPPPMRNVEGVWKVDLSTPGRVEVKDVVAQINRYTEVLSAINDDLKAGKLTSLKQVEAALEKAPKFEQISQLPPLVLAPMNEKR
ncbi:hypothetical protein BH09PLA1_BH09PLA1_07220 [soil metagenome]